MDRKIEYSIILAVVSAGVILQIATGPFPFDLISFPVNLILAIILLILSLARPDTCLGRFGSLSVSVFLIILIAIQSIVMGILPENGVKDSWPFVFTYFMLLLNLVLTIARRTRHFTLKDTGFMLNHTGLFVLLFAAGPGSADLKHYLIKIYEGESENHALLYGSTEVRELPLTLSLKDFGMEFYPPRLLVNNTKTGKIIPVDNGHASKWSFRIDSLTDKDHYALAAHVTAWGGGRDTSGWVSCGNYIQPIRTLQLDDGYHLSMAAPEPVNFFSNLTIHTKSGETREAVVRVNHPMKYRSWRVYQYSYDQERQRDSEYSVFELVYDPWLVPAYIGIFMLFAGALTLFWKGGKI